ncbi:CAZyme family GH71 and CBM24 [Penicillium roqueforti]|nr:CAZyme family GH71 and CBM24 [Penicillium roqueforti]KAI3238167.1 CAZyme family GH71 and CBM24 [Penicillium roqueforti]
MAVDSRVAEILPTAFQAAHDKHFSLFFSFDYAGNGPWKAGNVAALLEQYTASTAYYLYKGQYIVSTFEGPAHAEDWIDLKQQYNVFFVPDWSSIGAKPASQLGGGVADALFSWAGWPWGPQDMDTYTDASYYQYLNESGLKLYMMAVSPWFFTNLPGYDKNWLWRGDDLWYDRWVEVLYNQPEFVEIISWNDYGESHYIGPLYDYAIEAFTIGKAPSNFAKDMPYDGWRLNLPFLIDLYTEGTVTVTEENVVTWYRLSPGTACDSGTIGNTANQLQMEFAPSQIVQDRVFYSALLVEPAMVTVSIRGVVQEGLWTWAPDGKIGIYHGSVPFTGTGEVIVTISRDRTQLTQVTGKAISSACTDGLFNAWVGSATSPAAVSAKPPLSISEQACINGTGTYNFAGLCDFACSYGYCLVTAYTCRQMGKPLVAPNSTGVIGYPIAGEDASYSSLCAFNCNLGYCPSSACGTEQVPLVIPTVSDFAPPISSAQCMFAPALPRVAWYQRRPLQAPEPLLSMGWRTMVFAILRVAIGIVRKAPVLRPADNTDPEVQYIPPYKIILPPFPLGSTTTIQFPSMVSSIWTRSGTSTGTKTTILNVPSLVTDKVPFWPVVIGADTSPTGFYPLQSFMPESSELVLSGDEAPFSPVPSGSATPAPIFPGAPYTVTYQPQATKSISLSVNIPSVTWSSASPTESCTSGCGTDSCKLFGGCDSTDPIDDCGLYGCGGGCSIQSCDQSCGVACSTDQHHLDSDSTGSSGGGGGGGSDSGSSSSGGSADGQQANLPMDYDGPDGLANGEWNPTPILVEDAAAVTSGMSAIMAQGTPCFESALSLLTASQTVPADLYSTVHASATSLKQSMSTQISDLKDKINAADPENFQAVTSWFTTWQDDFNVRVDSMIQGIEEPYAEIELQVSLGRAQDDVDIFSEAASIEANEDICEINPNMGSSTHPITRKRAIPPSCAPDFQGDPGEPSNAAKIPEWIGCDTRLGFEYASSADILGAMKQGIKYFLSNARGVPRSGQPDWQTAAKAAYPHIYSNSDNIDFSDECMNAGGDYTGFIEFPIMPDGSILEAGRNSRIDVGVQRVVFKAKASRDRAATDWSYLYCGVMSHFTNLLETHIIDGEPKRVLPFKLCEATCASDVVGQCSWMWA